MSEVKSIDSTIAGMGLVARARAEAERLKNMPPEERAHELAAAMDPDVLPITPKPTFCYVPARFVVEDFNTFVPKTDSQRFALKVARRWVAAALEGQAPMLALIGPTGCGKSHLLYAAIQQLHAARPRWLVMSRPWYRLADQLRWGGPALYKPEADAKHRDAGPLRGQLFRGDAFAIDEVVKTSATDFDDTEMVKISHFAWDERRPVIITSRVLPLEHLLGSATASRFDQAVIEGPDGRQTP